MIYCAIEQHLTTGTDAACAGEASSSASSAGLASPSEARTRAFGAELAQAADLLSDLSLSPAPSLRATKAFSLAAEYTGIVLKTWTARREVIFDSDFEFLTIIPAP
jgi:hypothetical protein